MNKIFSYILLGAIGTMSLTACSKKEDPKPNTTVADPGKVYMEFFNNVGSADLKLNDVWYQNENGDSFKVSKLNYYISNVVLNGTSDTLKYTENESYHLVEHSATPANMAFVMPDVPGGKYKSVTFTIGVDSLRNVSGAQTGDLSQDKGNFWSWTTGYIMLKFEGISPQSTAAGNRLMLHSGGFSGANNVVKTITINFPNEVEVGKNSTPHIHLKADVLQMFKSPNKIDFATTSVVHMPGTVAKQFADNYAQMFSITYAGL